MFGRPTALAELGKSIVDRADFVGWFGAKVDAVAAKINSG